MLLNKIEETKMYIEPVSKNVMEAALAFSEEENVLLGFSTSRGQGGYRGGYVLNINSYEFRQFLTQYGDLFFYKKDQSITNEWKKTETGHDPLFFDVNILDVVHIDPWKNVTTIEDGIELTTDIIKYCYFMNKRCYFEIGTDQSTRNLTHNDLDFFLSSLQENLTEEEFDQILYVVVQSRPLFNPFNSSDNYDAQRLNNMLDVCKKYGKMGKDIDGDKTDLTSMKQKFQGGLSSVNLGKKLAEIEMQTILKRLKWSGRDLIDELFNLCLESSETFIPRKDHFTEAEKEKILIESGYHIFTQQRFIEIYNQMSGITDEIIRNLKAYLTETIHAIENTRILCYA